MGLFNDILKSNESVFKDITPLDYDYIPKMLKYRESQQKQVAYAIKPLLQERNGKNLFIHGAPGIGKTVACRHVLKELEEETETVMSVYINCWKNNTAFKILIETASQLGIHIVINQKTNELFDRVKQEINKKSTVFVFDEIDKIADLDVIYMVLEEIYRKSVCLIANYKKKLDERIMSRLNPEYIEFKPYNKQETAGILAERMKYAFIEGVWQDGAFSFVIEKTHELGDIRKGLFMMKESGNIAEESSSKKITIEHAESAWGKIEMFPQADDEKKALIEFIRQNNSSKIGDLFKKYNGSISYKTFQRRIEELEKSGVIKTEKVTGKEGNTTIVKIEQQ